MLIGGIALGLILGLIAGGHITNLAYIRLRRMGLIFAAVFLRFGTETLLNAGFPPAELLRLPLLAGSFVLLLIALWPNRTYPGISLAFIGILANAAVIVVNGGYMPIWEPALQLAGLETADIGALHYVLPPPLDANFLLHLGPFGDVIPIPLPIIQNVASIGDAFLTPRSGVLPVRRRRSRAAGARGGSPRGGPGASGRRAHDGRCAPVTRATTPASRRHSVGRSPGSGRSPWAAPAPAWPRPRRPRRPSTTSNSATTAPPDTVTIPIPRPSPEAVERVRQHPYVRLALNGSFSALWAGQLISLFGDRLNQLALVAVVATATGSVFATGLVFFAAMLPNVLLSPIAGTFVDRWDHKEVMVVSDILRAAIMLVIPIAAVTNIVLVYPLIFLVDQHLGLLPAGAGRDPAPDRPRARPPQRELGAVGRRDARRRHRLPAGRHLRGAPRERGPDRLLVRQRDLPRIGGAAGHDRRPGTPAVRGRGRLTRRGLPRRDEGRLAVPAPRDRPPRQHHPGGRRPVQSRHRDRPDARASSS